MNFAILKYQYVTDKPEDIPDEWIAEIRELGESTALPGENWLLMTAEELDSHKVTHQAIYDTWASNHYATPTAVIISKAIDRARVFGKSLTERFSVENVAMGITQAGKTRSLVLYCQSLLLLLETGSLYAAIDELNVLLADTSQAKADLSPFITNDRLNAAKNEILAYLGL